VLSGALGYAVELGHLDQHPLSRVKWRAPKISLQIDRQVTPNRDQSQRFLERVGETKPELKAFFGCIRFAGLRPEEARHLTEHEYERPVSKGAWGWLHLSGATVAPGSYWTDDGEVNEDRGLKHRAEKEIRSVPASPELCELLDWHIAEYPPARNGRLFVTRRGKWGNFVPTTGKPISNNACTTAFKAARKKAFTSHERTSPLCKKPYDLRHAWVSEMLSHGVPVPLIAKWAGHSPAVLLKIYAHVIWGQEEDVLQRLQQAQQAPTPVTDVTPLDGPKQLPNGQASNITDGTRTEIGPDD
jgi:integrase